MKKALLSLSAITLALGLAIGCGGSKHTTSTGTTGGTGSTPTPASMNHLGFHVDPGGTSAMTVARNTTEAQARLPWPASLAAAYLQTSSTTPTQISMSFSGFCQFLPTGWVNEEIKVYGLGSLDPGGCGSDPTLSLGAIKISDGSPVVGDGTLSELHVYAQNAGTDASSLVVKVYVNAVATSLTCTLGTSNKCADTTDLIPVKDGDMVAATVTQDSANGGLISGIRIMVGKS